MPELPDIEAYRHALEPRLVGRVLDDIRIAHPFLVRSVDPPVRAARGRRVVGVARLGKRIVIRLEDEFALVLHLMIAGRLHWRPPGAKLGGRGALAAFDVAEGSLVLTEAGTKRRASLHVVRGEAALAAHDPGGIDAMRCDPTTFAQALGRERHTLKRALTDPTLFSGIGNAYGDEILHAAGLSPTMLTTSLTADQVAALHGAARSVLAGWTERLIAEAGADFPERVTAFRPDMAVHGRHGQPCPRCATPIQRIVHGEHETNYCPTCQTGGRLLADRALSRLLKGDWPKTVDELERRRAAVRPRPT